jgi:hypothetical protein
LPITGTIARHIACGCCGARTASITRPEELTFSAAYRLNWTPLLSGAWLFFLPLVWLGFDPALVFGIVSASLLYQFWLHTTLIPRLGPLEWMLNTPSSHRVHHASNPEYLDRNYGGTLIVFDRLFGTYQAEDPAIAIRFGLVHPVDSLNPFVTRRLARRTLRVGAGLRGKVDQSLFVTPAQALRYARKTNMKGV